MIFRTQTGDGKLVILSSLQDPVIRLIHYIKLPGNSGG